MTKVRLLVVAAFIAVFGFAFGGSAFAQLGDLPGMDTAESNTEGGLEAPAVGELGNTEHGPCVEELLNLPALDSCRDAAGRVIMDLPALKLVSPAGAQPRSLPATGVNAGDFAAFGGVALAAGAALLRRVRLALAS
jgi:LPXTG-motif cell wall-anchored protein